ncbi:MAG: biotin--[Clostridia bacterium]|nr:biotin--[acetyl-CoA-carboxylase] ligase [Clostridia bacterium]
MDTRKAVLDMLFKANGEISGEELANRMGISRNSVWKAVNGLKKQGYSIASSKQGYRLVDDGRFNEYSIKAHLNDEHNIYIYKKETSSNTVAKELCRDGEGEGSVVIVESQTAGKGRMGRSFISESENGLYMSIILRPTIPADRCVNITVLCAVSVLEAIEKLTGKECRIKWVNDIYIGDKKCCGILTEASIDFESGAMQYAVVGIGVNMCPPKGGFDKDIADIACGIYENECPHGFKAKLCAEIINRFFHHYRCIENKEYINLYREKSNIIGNPVDVFVGERVISGIAVDIDCDARLVVKDDSGVSHSFSSGEARVKRQGK